MQELPLIHSHHSPPLVSVPGANRVPLGLIEIRHMLNSPAMHAPFMHAPSVVLVLFLAAMSCICSSSGSGGRHWCRWGSSTACSSCLSSKIFSCLDWSSCATLICAFVNGAMHGRLLITACCCLGALLLVRTYRLGPTAANLRSHCCTITL